MPPFDESTRDGSASPLQSAVYTMRHYTISLWIDGLCRGVMLRYGETVRLSRKPSDSSRRRRNPAAAEIGRDPDNLGS
jgi:hypothetical protein